MTGFTDQDVEYAPTPTADIAYRKLGEGPAVLLLHGWPLSSVTFRRLAPRLAEEHTCYLPDLPGGGLTRWKKEHDFSWPGQARAMQLFADRLGLERYLLFGQDSGAMIARCLALIDHPRVEKLAMINTEIPGHRPWLLWLYRKLTFLPGANLTYRLLFRWRRYMRTRLGFGDAIGDPALIDGEFRELLLKPLFESRRRMEGHLRFFQGWDFRLLDDMKHLHRGITAPTRLFWGEDDRTFPIERAREMVGQFPRAELTPVAGARLFVQEDRPQSLADGLLEFFRG